MTAPVRASDIGGWARRGQGVSGGGEERWGARDIRGARPQSLPLRERQKRHVGDNAFSARVGIRRRQHRLLSPIKGPSRSQTRPRTASGAPGDAVTLQRS